MNYYFSVKVSDEVIGLCSLGGRRLTKNYLSSSMRIILITMNCLHLRNMWNHVQLRKQTHLFHLSFIMGLRWQGCENSFVFLIHFLFWNISMYFSYLYSTPPYILYPISPVVLVIHYHSTLIKVDIGTLLVMNLQSYFALTSFPTNPRISPRHHTTFSCHIFLVSSGLWQFLRL